jgi:PleD family two-component response regulator
MANQPETSHGNILIVDDSPENLSVLTRMLAEEGYQVRPAISGELALKAIQKSPPDLVLLDIMMAPGIDGYEVCRQLKVSVVTRDIPIVFMSALHDTVNKVKAFDVGGVDYITKPFQIEEVLARVHTHLALRRLQKHLENKNAQLEDALSSVKTLRGLLPICASCKKIRDDQGYWKQIEEYIENHSEALFSHGLCPDCADKLYADQEWYQKHRKGETGNR